MDHTEWLLCPACKSKTRIKLRSNMTKRIYSLTIQKVHVILSLYPDGYEEVELCDNVWMLIIFIVG